jgi:PAP2 superfamily
MSNLIVQWNEVALLAIRALGRSVPDDAQRRRGGPPQVARSLGIIYTAIYDAWAAYDNTANPVHSAVARRPAAQRTEANRRKAISQAAYRALMDQFPPTIFEPTAKAAYEAAMAALLTAEGVVVGDNTTSTSNPVGVGNLAAKAVLDFRQADNANEAGLYAPLVPYVPKNRPMTVLVPAAVDAVADVGRWQPLSYLDSAGTLKTPAFIAPHWGSVTPFSLSSGSQFRPGPPQSVMAQGFLDQALHVVNVQATLTTQHKVIAEYWADGPNSEMPPGHWCQFAGWVAERDHLSLDQSVKLYFAVANAILDASIATWDCKAHYDYVRPVTAIRTLFRGKHIQAWGGPGVGTVSMPGENWRPFQADVFPTPPFSEFTSGHSAFSMAAATVLKGFTGSDAFGASYTQLTPLRADPYAPVGGVTLQWPTFTHAAEQAGESRLYGGIHFYEGNVVGLQIGKQVGQVALAKAQDHWSGAI